jgi:hypothetical protein
MEALASEKLDVGRAMKLAPLSALDPERLEELVTEATTLAQPDVQRLVTAVRRRPEEVARRVASVNARRVMEAYRRLMLVDIVDAEVHEALKLVARRVSQLCRDPSLSEEDIAMQEAGTLADRVGEVGLDASATTHVNKHATRGALRAGGLAAEQVGRAAAKSR